MILNKPTIPTVPTSLKNPNSLSFGNKSYDGSSTQTITAADLGLDSALKFHGTSSTAITDGSTTRTVTLTTGASHTAENGCVLFYGNKEFVWNGSSWEEFGNEGNYKTKQTALSSPSASGSTTAFIDTISQDTNGVITATKKNVSLPSSTTNNGEHTHGASGSFSGNSNTTSAPADASTTNDKKTAVASSGHTHSVSGTTSGQSATHSHTLPANTGSAGGSHSHTFSSGSASATANNTTNIVSVATAAHTHDVTGTVGTTNIAHTHTIGGSTGNASADHTHTWSDTSDGPSATTDVASTVHKHTVTPTGSVSVTVVKNGTHEHTLE